MFYDGGHIYNLELAISFVMACSVMALKIKAVKEKGLVHINYKKSVQMFASCAGLVAF